jgi:hypothetical protein
MSITNPGYVSLDFPNLNPTDANYSNLNAEKKNYLKDIHVSTELTNILTYDKNRENSLKNSNPIHEERQLQINRYYILKYQAQSNVFKLIIFFCGLAIIGCLFYMKGFIGQGVYIFYLGIILVIGFLSITYSIYNLFFRDTIHYDESDFGLMSAPGNGLDMTTTSLTNSKSNSNVKSDTNNKCIL